MTTPPEPTLQLAERFRPPPHVYDELCELDGTPRAHWRMLAESAAQTPVDEFVRRSAQADELLRENGVSFNAFGETSQRPWQLDLLPLVIPAGEWRLLELALSQRARLLQFIIRDAYGPQQLLKEGALPPEILFGNPRFQRAFHGLHRTDVPPMVTYAAELARGPSGQWYVMADRAEAPAGLAFALENRIVASRTMPASLHRQPVQRLASFFLRLQNTLKLLAARHSDNPRIVLLSAGPQSPYYFEDVYLARYLGYTLVEGGDLAVRDDRVYLKTLGGLVTVDVVVSRGSEGELDPLELGGAAPHGVPGLLHALRKSNVSVANTPGCGLVESPVFMAFLPKLCRYYLGESLVVPSIPTWWCAVPRDFAYVKENLVDLVIKPAFQASGGAEILGNKLSAAERRELIDHIGEVPHLFVAQELIARSAAPVWKDGQIGCGHVALRTFLVSDHDNFNLMPGALIRVAPTPEPMALSISAGICSKDLWVLADGPVEPVSLLRGDHRPVPLRRTGAFFPSRIADDLFWLGQSLDRADFLCRLLRAVIERLIAETEQDWPELPALVRALAEQGQIEQSFAVSDFFTALPALQESLPRFIGDADESHGVAFAVKELERLASLVRLWISPDTWRMVHHAASTFHTARERWSGLVEVLDAINQLIVDLAAVSGLVHDGMIRGPAWRLMDIGRRIERARNLARLLKCTSTVGGFRDKTILKALLEVVDCRMTYRSRYLDNLQQNAVLDLCLTDDTNPRSIVSQLVALAEHVDALPQDFASPLRTEEKRLVMAAVHSLRMLGAEQLEADSAESIATMLDLTERQLTELSDVLTRKYLLHSGAPRQITGNYGEA